MSPSPPWAHCDREGSPWRPELSDSSEEELPDADKSIVFINSLGTPVYVKMSHTPDSEISRQKVERKWLPTKLGAGFHYVHKKLTFHLRDSRCYLTVVTQTHQCLFDNYCLTLKDSRR